MSFESFYGGRQGASFVIVKRFDGLDIPEKSIYKFTYYAIDENGIIRYPFIEKTENNYNYKDWTSVELNGSSVQVVLSDGTISTQVLDIVYQEGMRQCFEKGGDSVDVVNYGEYVIIDTVSKDNPENGKIFRRGMNYDYDPVNNPLAGAEYIGQITGPKGSTAEIDIDAYREVIDIDSHQEREYTEVNESLIPGTDVNRTEFNDEIKYAWATVRDEAGNVANYKIGFTFPYLIPEISGSVREPYYTQEDYNEGRITDENLIGTAIKFVDDFDLFIDNGEDTDDRIPDHGDTGHPFYRKWKFNVPKGIKGNSFSDLKAYPTIVVQGSEVYPNVDSEGHLSGEPIVLDTDARVDFDECLKNFNKGYVKIEVNGVPYYSDLTNTAEVHCVYVYSKYDNYSEEDERHYREWEDIGAYRTIEDTSLDEYGNVTVTYTAGAPDLLEHALRWIWLQNDPERTKGVQIEDDGTITIWYNTLDEHGEHEFQKYDNILEWIESTSLDRRGHFKIDYNNNEKYDPLNPYYYDPATPGTWSPGWSTADNKASWETDLTWPTQVTLTQAGVLKFLYNNNLLQDIYPTDPTDGTVDRTEGSYSFILPWLTKVKLYENGIFNFKFNNDRLYDPTDSDWSIIDHTLYQPRITWITKARLTSDGTFKLYFNNNKNKAAVIADGGTWIDADNAYQAIIAWVANVEVAEDGTLIFIYCDDKPLAPHRYRSPYKIKYLKNVSINTESSAGAGEGTGNQKVHLVWNTVDSVTGLPQEEDVGEPLNYIIESTISIPNVDYPNVPYWHLLVYYSDPELRSSLSSKWVTYPSTKEPGVIRNQWVDLGSVKGENTGIHILKNVESMDELKDFYGHWIPPELLEDEHGVILNPDAAGWSCTLQEPETDVTVYLFYDYEAKIWYKGTSVDPSAVDPSYVVAKSSPDPNQQPWPGDVDNLKSNGFWFAVETGIAVK